MFNISGLRTSHILGRLVTTCWGWVPTCSWCPWRRWSPRCRTGLWRASWWRSAWIRASSKRSRGYVDCNSDSVASHSLLVQFWNLSELDFWDSPPPSSSVLVGCVWRLTLCLTLQHCSDKIILGAQGDVKKVAIIPWHNWNILPEDDLECNEIIQRAAFPRHVIFSFRILCPLRSFNAEQNNSEEFLFW